MMRQVKVKKHMSKMLLRRLQIQFSSQQKTHQSHVYTRSCKAVFLSLEVRVCHIICLGENSHWKVGVWGEEPASFLTCVLPSFPHRAQAPEADPQFYAVIALSLLCSLLSFFCFVLRPHAVQHAGS